MSEAPQSLRTPSTDDTELDERRLRVIADQAAGLRWQIALTAAIVGFVAWPWVPPWLVVTWFLAVMLFREWRASKLLAHASDRTLHVRRRIRRTVVMNLVLGAINGAAAVFMAWTPTVQDAVLTMILVSWAAGAVSTSSTVKAAFLAYAAMIFVPTALAWLLRLDALGLGVGALVLMFFGVQMRFARANLRTFEESFAMRRENESLARELAVEGSELALARDVAEQASREKSRFLAAASHDLRQPLQAITLNSGELLRLALPEEARAMATDLRTSVEHLRSMLDALLDVSKLDAGVVVPQLARVRADRLVESVAAGFRVTATARGLGIDTHCAPELGVLADPELLRRMLANLIDNAIKFTPSGRVAVSAEADGDDVNFAVRDSGPGIAPQDHRIIFEDMVRLPADQADAQRQGHGLGLGIVRRAAALMNTHVEVESSLGQGATFRWRLPRADAPQAVAGSLPTAWSLVGREILILDDDAMVRGAYANALAGLGATARASADVVDALGQLGEADAAVVDRRLAGEYDGFDAVALLRECRPGLAVVMVTADTGRSIDASAARMGVTLLHKPVDANTLGRELWRAIDVAERAAGGIADASHPGVEDHPRAAATRAAP